MGRARIPASERRSVTVISQVTPAVREQVEKVADRQKLSISQLGARAIEQYVKNSAKKDG